MILSTSHRFIFVHVPKTAGWSMMDTLQPSARAKRRTLLRSLSRRLPITEPPESAHFHVHETAEAMISKPSRPVWDSAFSFAVVRDPFDHAVSNYEHLKQHRSASVARRFQQMSFEGCIRTTSHGARRAAFPRSTRSPWCANPTPASCPPG